MMLIVQVSCAWPRTASIPRLCINLDTPPWSLWWLAWVLIPRWKNPPCSAEVGIVIEIVKHFKGLDSALLFGL